MKLSLCFKAIALAVAAVALVSCASVRDVAYMQQKAEHGGELSATPLYDGKIVAKDILTINIQASKPELVATFNGSYWTPTQQYSSVAEQLRSYLVDNDGTVDLPIMGRVKLAGLTLTEAQDRVRKHLTSYLNEVPSVNIKILNYRFSVLGEVRSPGFYKAENGKATIYDALSMAGDMTIYGDRTCVKVLRENSDGSKEIAVLDLRKADIINSPYYYIRQGDVVYVQPNSAQAKASNISTGVTIWFSVASIGFSLVNLLVALLRK